MALQAHEGLLILLTYFSFRASLESSFYIDTNIYIGKSSVKTKLDMWHPDSKYNEQLIVTRNKSNLKFLFEFLLVFNINLVMDGNYFDRFHY